MYLIVLKIFIKNYICCVAYKFWRKLETFRIAHVEISQVDNKFEFIFRKSNTKYLYKIRRSKFHLHRSEMINTYIRISMMKWFNVEVR